MSTKLKDANLNNIESEGEEEIYEVEEILDKKKFGAKWKYQVKWVGFGLDQTTWEPAENLNNVDYMIEEFEKNWVAPAKNKVGRKPTKSTKIQNNLSISTPLETIKENMPNKNEKQNQENSKIIEDKHAHDNRTLLKKRKLNEIDEEKNVIMTDASEIYKMNNKSSKDINLNNTQNVLSSAMITNNSQLSERSPHLKEINQNVISSTNLKSNNANKFLTSNMSNSNYMPNEEAIIIGDDENYAPKIYGSFESKDIPKRLITARLVGSNNEVNCLVEWLPRDNGIKPSDTFISNKILRERCPNLLLDFYESRLRFPANTVKK
jgi:hypothetical protein